jgi:hypothetical protein
MRRFATMLCAFGFCGCDALTDALDAASTPDPCDDDSGAPPALDGVWRITGNVGLEGCADETLDGGGYVMTSAALRVKADGDGGYALDESTGAPTGFALDVEGTMGRCVFFNTRERARIGGTAALTFDGVEASGRITGRVTGTVGEGCVASGNFALDIHRGGD